MLTQNFERKTKERITEMRSILTNLREAYKEAAKQLAKIEKQHVKDRERLYERIGELAEDVVTKMPEEASDEDMTKALAIQQQVENLAADIEEISLTGTAIEDLGSLTGDAINEAYAGLKEAEAQLANVERLATKLGI